MFESEQAIDSKISGYAKSGLVQVPLYALGFVWGTTEANAKAGAYNGKDMTTQLLQRTTDTLTNLGLGGITIAQGFTSASGGMKIQPLGWINKGLAAAIGATVYKDLNLPLATTIHALVFPFGVGYSIGGIFDPITPNSAAQHSPSGQQYQVAPGYAGAVSAANAMASQMVRP